MSLKKSKGFSLIELVITIITLSIISVMSAKLLTTWFATYLAGQEKTNAYWQGNIALQRLSSDLASIAAPNAITNANASDISFTDNQGNVIRYGLKGQQLILSFNNASEVLADDINHLAFQYLDQHGNATSDIANTYYIQFSFGLANTADVFDTMIAIRNIS